MHLFADFWSDLGRPVEKLTPPLASPLYVLHGFNIWSPGGRKPRRATFETPTFSFSKTTVFRFRGFQNYKNRSEGSRLDFDGVS